MKRLDITEEQVFSIKPALANLSYTNYMLSVAQTGGPMEIVASILACSWSYAEIGQALAAIPGAAEHPFYGFMENTCSSGTPVRNSWPT